MKALTNEIRNRIPRVPVVSLCAAVLILVLFAGCDSRPAVDPSKTASAPLVQGELIQPKSVSNTAPATLVPAVATALTNLPPPLSLSTGSTTVGVIQSVSSNEPTASVSNSLAQAYESPKEVNGFLGIGFDRLSAFNFEVTDDILQSGSTNAAQVASRTAEQIPKTVMSYDQKRIALKGFMLPLKVEGGKVTELLIMRDQSMCCYGSVPKINEWVSVKMVGEGVRPIMDQAITLYGKLYVGEMRENGYLVGIYRMDGERIDGPAEN